MKLTTAVVLPLALAAVACARPTGAAKPAPGTHTTVTRGLLMCPLVTEGVEVEVQERPAGAALVFTTEVDRDGLREQLAGIAHFHNRGPDATWWDDWVTVPSRARVETDDDRILLVFVTGNDQVGYLRDELRDEAAELTGACTARTARADEPDHRDRTSSISR